ncbi:cysteine-rich DPF motif domain-containing protein 1 [Drosophila subobscura]|uniref:cysteine-rich DPF motif domain-containing protein 1 n=1 Tax=Drosophila subobscura TaxID=7241 RepID=UPI00155B0C94|nr:cysteine-rich DPF motif domain-containing protein 1 [Drosophila subobscura]XP_034663651.1 cysteine-rich DPF motif domain-containing protein 1 [Drosophila subobscura]XP_034663652.1 cysteine-rich DPF motif domain-containing protein 1 [Drosophila subobscura]
MDEDDQPSTSSASRSVNVDIDEDIGNDLDDEDLVLNDEAAEIARLQLPEEDEKPKEELDPKERDERIAKIDFRCSACDMHELVHYFGREPPFALGIKYLENTFVMRDPFQPPPPRWQMKPEYYIAIGSHCSSCSKVVCKDAACSYYYTKTVCLPCGKAELKDWPVEAQARFRKQLAAAEADKDK